jgi:hypothetical protein
MQQDCNKTPESLLKTTFKAASNLSTDSEPDLGSRTELKDHLPFSITERNALLSFLSITASVHTIRERLNRGLCAAS